ncbi:hypothetical protein ACFQY4_25545 [Catellatospora bangladeshensis]|uniref:hypothetical protein n=1 Tax=Catellatospora bangladeshensis TaxID=310355 RepID=UPI00360D1B57
MEGSEPALRRAGTDHRPARARDRRHPRPARRAWLPHGAGGEKWVRAVPPWITATQTEQAAFIAGFKSARYVIDAGTAHERSITVGPEILRSGTIPNDVQPPATRGLPYVVPVSPVLRPLRPGTHTSTLFVTMKERVCTGRGPAPGLSADCLEAGESEYPIADNGPFTVLTGPPPPTP